MKVVKLIALAASAIGFISISACSSKPEPMTTVDQGTTSNTGFYQQPSK